MAFSDTTEHKCFWRGGGLNLQKTKSKRVFSIKYILGRIWGGGAVKLVKQSVIQELTKIDKRNLNKFGLN